MLKNRPKRIIAGTFLFILAIIADLLWDTGNYRIVIFALPYLVSGHAVLATAIRNLFRGKVFDEFSLMSLATLGAFIIGEYPEGVFVMLFYEVGEYAQHRAVLKARRQIESLVDQRPEKANILQGGEWTEVPAENVTAGSIILIKKGEQVPIDGRLKDDRAVFNTASITGEPIPRHFLKEEEILSGYLNEGAPIQIKTTSLFEESTFSRIIRLTQEASRNKAPTETFFRKFAKVYTPAVAILAVAIFLIPVFYVESYQWQEWLYRACVFLVISCPCALVLSIPLTYFAGIGSAGKAGILTKGANHLDQLSKLKGIVFDKTGTLTKGELVVKDMTSLQEADQLLSAAKMMSSQSSHPVSQAISNYLPQIDTESQVVVNNIEELSGKGIQGKFNGKLIQLGSPQWVSHNSQTSSHQPHDQSVVYLSYNGSLVCIFSLNDELKEDAKDVIQYLKDESIETYLLSGDREKVVEKYGAELPFYRYKGAVDPEGKLETYLRWRKNSSGPIAFAGDGINDSIVMAASDLGIAMGNKGADIAIESADIVIPGDRLSHIPQAIQISRKTQSILWQNIILVLLVKLIVLILGGVGFVSLWVAILADVGIALLAVLNASRLIYYKPKWQ